MAGSFKLYKWNEYEQFNKENIAYNSLTTTQWMALKLAPWTGFVQKAGVWDTIVWVANTAQTFDSDNQTVAMSTVKYLPKNDNITYKIPVVWVVLTFAGALIASNTVNLKVAWTSMTQETFDTDNNTTLDNIAAQLVTDFPTLIASAVRSGTRSVIINPIWLNSSVAITNIVVAAGSSQTTWSVADSVVLNADVWDYFDITATNQYVTYSTKSTSTWQLRLESVLNGWKYWEFTIANL